MAYFLLDGASLSEEKKRGIVLDSGSPYDVPAFQHAMKVNYHDIHEKERARRSAQPHHSGGKFSKRPFHKRRGHAHQAEGDEDEEGEEELDAEEDAAYENEEEGTDEAPSDCGASGDDEVFEAYSTYKQARRKLK